RDIGDEAVWSLSTAKPGNGVIQLREDDKDTYWQSDGAHPHMINIQFYKKMTITAVAFYVDYSVDESYCPKTISIRAGNTFHDLAEVTLVEMKEGGCEMNGWNRVALHAAGDGDAPLRAFDACGGRQGRRGWLAFSAFCVVEMYQNGRDTHVRQLKIFGPRQP
ncbi:unnamed protein product, partial [Phaeothamnion confervicola]